MAKCPPGAKIILGLEPCVLAGLESLLQTQRPVLLPLPPVFLSTRPLTSTFVCSRPAWPCAVLRSQEQDSGRLLALPCSGRWHFSQEMAGLLPSGEPCVWPGIWRGLCPSLCLPTALRKGIELKYVSSVMFTWKL